MEEDNVDDDEEEEDVDDEEEDDEEEERGAGDEEEVEEELDDEEDEEEDEGAGEDDDEEDLDHSAGEVQGTAEKARGAATAIIDWMMLRHVLARKQPMCCYLQFPTHGLVVVGVAFKASTSTGDSAKEADAIDGTDAESDVRFERHHPFYRLSGCTDNSKMAVRSSFETLFSYLIELLDRTVSKVQNPPQIDICEVCQQGTNPNVAQQRQEAAEEAQNMLQQHEMQQVEQSGENVALELKSDDKNMAVDWLTSPVAALYLRRMESDETEELHVKLLAMATVI
eukprot:g983.t1